MTTRLVMKNSVDWGKNKSGIRHGVSQDSHRPLFCPCTWPRQVLLDFDLPCFVGRFALLLMSLCASCWRASCRIGTSTPPPPAAAASARRADGMEARHASRQTTCRDERVRGPTALVGKENSGRAVTCRDSGCPRGSQALSHTPHTHTHAPASPITYARAGLSTPSIDWSNLLLHPIHHCRVWQLCTFLRLASSHAPSHTPFAEAPPNKHTPHAPHAHTPAQAQGRGIYFHRSAVHKSHSTHHRPSHAASRASATHRKHPFALHSAHTHLRVSHHHADRQSLQPGPHTAATHTGVPTAGYHSNQVAVLSRSHLIPATRVGHTRLAPLLSRKASANTHLNHGQRE